MKPFTRADQDALEAGGYYWILRNEPDGPPEWEIARFTGECWYVTGSSQPKYPTTHPQASNAWRLGARVEPPKAAR